MPEIITSRQNSRIRHLRKLAASKKYREEQRQFICDGHRCLSEAAGTGLVTVIYAREGINTSGEKLLSEPGAQVFYLTDDLMEYAAPVVTPGDFIFTCRFPFEAYNPDFTQRYIVLDGIGDPGNAGTIIRSAAAMNFDGVLLVNACADAFSPKTVRSAMGALFKIPVKHISPDELSVIKSSGMRLFGADMEGASADGFFRDKALPETPGMPGFSIIVGSEGAGLSEGIRRMCDDFVSIPMNSKVESLNAAIAASILMWEADKCL